MSLVKRETSPAQVAANRANSLQSTGPRTEAGKAASSRNALKPQGLSSPALLSLQALGEDPAEFHRQLEVLSESMRPRDGWEAAWVQDIAMLRRRIDRLQRAEAGVLAVRRMKLAVDRKHASLPPSGLADLRMRQQIPMVGFTGLPDSPWKFRQVLDTLHGLRDLMRCGMYEADGVVYFNLLYGKNPGLVGATLRGPFEALSRRQAKEEVPDGDNQQRALVARIDQEIENYEQQQALFETEHPADNPASEDAVLLLPTQELTEIIRYEAHLENQIERKLRQFYARRRESTIVEAESLPEAKNEDENHQVACEACQA